MTRFGKAMSLLLSLCLVMTMLSPKVLAAELSENTNLDNTVSASEALPVAPGGPPEQDCGEEETLQMFQAGSVTGFQTLPDGPALFSSGSNNEEALYHTILNGLLNRSQMIDIRSFWIPSSEAGQIAFSQCYRRVLDDHPEIFYVSGVYNVWGNESYITGIAPIYHTDLPDNCQQLFEAAAQKALAQVQPGMSQMEAMLVLYDYLAINCVYNWEVATKNPGPADKPDGTYSEKVYTAYGALVEGDTVCQGYTLAYKYLLNKLGIPCILVRSDEMNHAWNQVCLGGQWYHVDVTYDDLAPNTYGQCLHNFFLLSDQAISDASHGHHHWMSPNSCTDTTFDTGYVYPNVFHPFHWKDRDIFYLEYDRSASRERLWKDAGDGREEIPLQGYPDPNSGVCWLDDCLYYIGWDSSVYDANDRGIYYYDINSGRQGCLGYFSFTPAASFDNYYPADCDHIGMRYHADGNVFTIESSTRPGQAPVCRFNPVDLPDYPAAWDNLTGTQIIGTLSDGRLGVRTEVDSAVLWVASYDGKKKLIGLERQTISGTGIHLVSLETSISPPNRVKLMLISHQGAPLCAAYQPVA